MKQIERRNILRLIGRSARNYHSCIMTSFSFDYVFFEQRLLPVFRANSIRNIIVLADGSSLDYANEQLIHGKAEKSLGYSICPVYHNYAFHPKVMLIAGEKEGLLFIGSGNLTNSGISTNDEIWSAFRFVDNEEDTKFIFGSAWAYLKSFTQHLKATNLQKINWIEDYAPWIKELPVDSDRGTIEKHGLDIWFMRNKPGSPIFSQTATLIPAAAVQSITVVSPYYDEQGDLLEKLYAHYNPGSLHCISDFKTGLLPHKLDDALRAKISFFKWSDLREDYNSVVNRLHAKLLHFKCSDDVEYLLLGSANATMAGLGSLTQDALNEEVSLLIKRESKETWLEQLGISTNNATPVALKGTEGLERSNAKKWQGVGYRYRIIYAELNGTELSLFMDRFEEDTVWVGVEDAVQNPLLEEALEINSSEVRFTCSAERGRKILRLYLKNDAGCRISNYAIVHHAENLQRGNPDPSLGRLNELLSKEEFSTSDWRDLLQYAYEDSLQRSGTSHPAGGSSGSRSDFTDEYVNLVRQSEESRTLSKESFNQQAEFAEDDPYNKSLQNMTSVYHLLMEVGADLNREEDFEENEEQMQSASSQQTGEGESVSKRQTRTLKENQVLQKNFIAYLSKIKRNLEAKKRLTEKDGSKAVVTLHELLQALIGLEIMLKMRNVKLSEADLHSETNSEVGKSKDAGLFFEQGEVGDDFRTIKGFLLEIVGGLISFAKSGFETYESEERNKTVLTRRKEIVEKALRLINFVKWKRLKEIRPKQILMLNLFHWINPDGEEISIPEEHGVSTEHNLEEANQLLTDYSSWKSKYYNQEEKERYLLKPLMYDTSNQMIFHKNYGFAMIKKVTRFNPGNLSSVQLLKLGADRKHDYISPETFFKTYVSFRIKRTDQKL